MPTGLQVFNADGIPSLTLTDRLTVFQQRLDIVATKSWVFYPVPYVGGSTTREFLSDQLFIEIEQVTQDGTPGFRIRIPAPVSLSTMAVTITVFRY